MKIAPAPSRYPQTPAPVRADPPAASTIVDASLPLPRRHVLAQTGFQTLPFLPDWFYALVPGAIGGVILGLCAANTNEVLQARGAPQPSPEVIAHRKLVESGGMAINQSVIMRQYVLRHAKEMSLRDVFELARGLPSAEGRDGLMIEYARARGTALSVDDALTLAKSVTNGRRGELLLESMANLAPSLAAADAIRVVKAAPHKSDRDSLALTYQRARASDLRPVEVYALAAAAQR